MINRPRLFMAAALVATLGLPAIARSAEEPVATAPIPPPPAASSQPATPMFIPPNGLPSGPKAGAVKPVAEAPKSEPGKGDAAKKKALAAARAHRAKRQPTAKQLAQAKREKQQAAAKVAPPIPRKTTTRPRYYAGAYPRDAGFDGPPPPPWYDGPPFGGYYPPPWRRW